MSTNEFLHEPPEELKELAEAFVTWIQRPDPFTRDAPHAELAAYVNDSPRMLAEDQIEAYRIQYFSRLCGALDDDYRALAAHLGTDAWHRLVRDFLDAQPPRDWNLYRLGAALPAFLASHPLASHDARACDLARLEWAFCDAFGDPDGTPLTAAALAAIDPEALGDLVLFVQPALRLVKLAYPLADARIALRAGEHVDLGECALKTTFLVVARALDSDVTRGQSLEYMNVSAAAFYTLSRLRRGEPLGAALEGAAEDAGATEDEMLGSLGTWFQNWTAWGWLVTGT